MQDKWIYLNNQLALENEAKISPFDHGFLYGHGLFETMRVYHGKVFCLDEHLKRLHDGSKVLEWPEWFDAEVLSTGIYQTLEKNQLQEASVRLTVSRGIGASRPDPSTCSQMTVAVFAHLIHPLSAEVYEQGWSLAQATIRRNLTSPLCGLKVANYLDHILARAEARQKGASEALLLNTDGNVAEGTMCNVFFVLDHLLVTPDEKSGLLPGITRSLVLKIARDIGIKVEERQVHPDELLRVSEMFITSSLLEIMPVTILDQRIIKDGRPGPITKKIQKEYKLKVERSWSATERQ